MKLQHQPEATSATWQLVDVAFAQNCIEAAGKGACRTEPLKGAIL
jgi:hypothetical protein